MIELASCVQTWAEISLRHRKNLGGLHAVETKRPARVSPAFPGAPNCHTFRLPPRNVRCAAAGNGATPGVRLVMCKRCKQLYDPAKNPPNACRFHPNHYGGETKRKFQSVHSESYEQETGGGEIQSYWHCCGNQKEDAPGCEAAPHASWDD
eukprot:jgi/Mesvir1/23673/Mv25765-RA.1